ncbi:MAG: hypothetical protein AAFX87_31875 [Bacteroidota bacterium]
MIRRFLRAKHWQLFMLTFGAPMIMQFITIAVTIASMSDKEQANPSLAAGFMMFFMPLTILLYVGATFGWFWSVVIGLQNYIPEEAKIKLTRFKSFFFIPLTYMVVLSLFIAFSMAGITQASGTYNPNPGLIGVSVLIMVPLHLFSMFCIFHSIYFVAKTFKTAELHREANFSDFAGEFFLIWFYPIGVWIIQPKINKIVNDNFESET